MPLLTPGLVTITFRSLSPAEVIALAAEAEVRSLEWGGDIHVPPTDLQNALAVAVQTYKGHARVTAYGSYYRAGVTDEPGAFEQCLQTAAVLGAPLIRVWAGSEDAENVDTRTWKRVIQDLNRICTLAARAGIRVATEFHGETLCNTADSAIRVLTQANSPNLRTLWQPLGDASPDERAAEVRQILPFLAHVHVYHWPQGNPVPLAQGEEEWRAILDALIEANHPVRLLLEHVAGDSPEQFLQDAATLRGWIKKRE